MIYLIIGVDRGTFAHWHQNVHARDAQHATRIAEARAQADGVDLVVAAVIGTYSSIVDLL